AEAGEAAEAARIGRQQPFPDPSGAPDAPHEAPAAVPHQPSYGDWDAHAGGHPYAETGAAAPEYGAYGGDQYGAVPPQQYPAGAYDQTYQDGHSGQDGHPDPYQGAAYDPYGYGDQTQAAPYGQPYPQDQGHQAHQGQGHQGQGHQGQGHQGQGHQGYEEQPYDPAQHHPHGIGNERPDGSQQ
ncbi:hypothetical protein G3I35_14030, partial [Streptomyces sp. SID10815]|nr:hypothetical protein [Streptomyces sp. SID10815]